MLDEFVPNEEFMKINREATQRALGNVVDPKELAAFLDGMESGKGLMQAPSAAKAPAPAEAMGETFTVGIYGYVKCTPSSLDHTFQGNHWGVGLAALTAYGTMYTAYDSWSALFRETKGYHAQGVAEAGGIFQITWFNKKSLPVGQFSAVAAGLGVFEVGGSGSWSKK